eukprot:Seg1775.6 transcript_id=Seg1775.6/GoldUCD/mRNA.D3Y31 product="hypothetical protein" protein_id=Seg1775.6/GoldUCD/D3Y31
MVLDELKIKAVCQLCDDFGEAYPVLFSGPTITRKMHNLTHKIPKFVIRWRSARIFTEEAGESIYNAFNEEGKILACLGSSPNKILLLMQSHERSIRAQLLSEWGADRMCDTYGPA